MQSRIKRLLALIIILLCSLVLINSTNADAATYKTTKFKSLSAVEMNYRKNCTKNASPGIHSAYQKIKTKYGDKKALFIYRDGFTNDLIETSIFIKNKKKVLKVSTINGVPYMISKNKKYILVSGGGAFSSAYKYSNDKYKKFKFALDDLQTDSEGQLRRGKAEKWQNKYKITSSINFKYKKTLVQRCTNNQVKLCY